MHNTDTPFEQPYPYKRRRTIELADFEFGLNPEIIPSKCEKNEFSEQKLKSPYLLEQRW